MVHRQQIQGAGTADWGREYLTILSGAVDTLPESAGLLPRQISPSGKGVAADAYPMRGRLVPGTADRYRESLTILGGAVGTAPACRQ